jgi:hypothetical protein
VYVQRDGALVVDGLISGEGDAGSGCYGDGCCSRARGSANIAAKIGGGERSDGGVVGDRADVLVERALCAVRCELLEHVCWILLVCWYCTW